MGLYIGQTVLINTGDNESSRSLEQELALVGLHIGHNWPLPVIEAHAQAWPCLLVTKVKTGSDKNINTRPMHSPAF